MGALCKCVGHGYERHKFRERNNFKLSVGQLLDHAYEACKEVDTTEARTQQKTERKNCIEAIAEEDDDQEGQITQRNLSNGSRSQIKCKKGEDGKPKFAN